MGYADPGPGQKRPHYPSSCEQNSIFFYAYNYWKRLLKEEYVDSCLPDIVQVAGTPSNQAPSCELRNSRNSYEPQPIRICTADADVSISPMASDDLVLWILKAVRYA